MIYGNKYLSESSNNISFYEELDDKSNNYCNKICDSLSKKEKEEFGIIGNEKHMSKERFKKVKDKILKRIVLIFNGEAAGFIEVYRENRQGTNYGEISVVVHSNHRNKGYASILMQKIIEWYKNFSLDIKSLTYPVDKNNTSSINLAKKFGFKKMNKSEYYFSEEYYNDYPVYQYKK